MSGHSRAPFRADPRERDIVILDADGGEVARLQTRTEHRPAPNERKRRANAWLFLGSPEFLKGSKLLIELADNGHLDGRLDQEDTAILAAVREAVKTYENEV